MGDKSLRQPQPQHLATVGVHHRAPGVVLAPPADVVHLALDDQPAVVGRGVLLQLLGGINSEPPPKECEETERTRPGAATWNAPAAELGIYRPVGALTAGCLDQPAGRSSSTS